MRAVQPRAAGFTLVEVIVVMAVVGLLAGLLLAAVQRVRAAAARAACGNNLRNVALALHQYHDAHSVLPPGNVSAEKPAKLAGASWLVFVLPHVEQDALWRKAVAAHTASPIYTTRNRFAVPPHDPFGQVVPVYTCPADQRLLRPAYSPYMDAHAAFTSYLGVNGDYDLCELDADTRPTPPKCGLFGTGSRYSFRVVTDGLSNTLFVGERPPPQENTHGFWYGGFPYGSYKGATNTSLGVTEGTSDQFNVHQRVDECKYDPDCELFSHYQPGSLSVYESRFHFWSLHPGGAHFALCDGSVRFVGYGARAIMPALASRAGGEAVEVP